MGIKSGLNCQAGAKNSNVGGVKQYIDTAFDDVQKVANNLEALLELNNTFQNLKGVYLGEFSDEPTQRPNGDPLVNGDHFLNTNTSLLYVYLDGNWIYHSIFYTQSALNAAVGQGPFNIWIAYADDNIGTNISLNPSGKSYIGFANSKSTSVVDITDASIFAWNKSIGVDGVNSYLHIAYADSDDGFSNFSFTTGNYIGVYTDTIEADSSDPVAYNWNRIRGIDGLPGSGGDKGDAGTSVVVTDLGGGRISISDGISTVFLDDGEIPTLIDNGDGTYTITSGVESVTFSDGQTPLLGIDYYDGNNGDYITFVFAQVAKGADAPIILAGTGTWNGTIETFPTGAAWSDNAVFTSGQTTYMSKNRYQHDIITDIWTLRTPNWSTPTIFMDVEAAIQSQVKGLAFIRSATTPVTLATGGTFLSPTPTTGGWSDGIPSGTLPIYICSAVFTSDGLTPQSVGNPVVWTAAQLLAENGLGFKLRFSEFAIGPWADLPDEDSLYMITSVRDSAGIWNDNDASVVRIKGETGSALQTQVRSFCFKRSSNPAFSETPQGGTFLDPQPVDGTVVGWTDGIPAGTDRLYISTRIFTSDGLTPQQTVWAVSQVFTYNGTGFRSLFSEDGLTAWHVEPTVDDEYMQAQVSDDGGVTWTDLGAPIKIKGETGPQGVPGTGAQTIYTWLKYADDAIGTNLTDDPDGKLYMGLAVNKTTATESTTAGDYTWSKIGGDQGVPGTNGDTNYTWVKYADNSAGGGLSDDPTGKSHIGLAFNKTVATESVIAGDYEWALFRGTDGIPGETGAGIYTLAVTGSTTADSNSLTGNNATDWVDGGYTEESYAGACYASFRLINTGDRLMAGISAADGSLGSYTDIDYAFYRRGDDVLKVFELGVDKGTFGTATDTDVLTIVDNGTDTRYFQNGTLLYTSLTAPAGISHRFKASFAGVGDTVTNIVFGPIGERGTDGEDALGTLPIPFNPGVVGGAGDFIFTLDMRAGGVTNVGEIRIQGSKFQHPDGTERILQTDADLLTSYGEGGEGQFFLMWTDEDAATRFPGRTSYGTATNIVPIRNVSGTWFVMDNSTATNHAITIVATDCILAAVHAEATSGGLTSIVPFVSGSVGLDGVRGTKHYYTTVTTGVWTDAVANAYILSQGDVKQVWDVVTISDAPSGFSQTKYWTGSVWSIIAEVIDGNLIVLGTIKGNRLEVDTITALQIAANVITANEIAAGTITAIQIAAQTISTGLIADDAITPAQLAANAVTAAAILNGTITGVLIADDTITATNIAANTITANEILAGTITANEITVASLASLSINVGELVGGSITGSTLKTADTGKRVLMNTSDTPLSVFNDDNELIFGTIIPPGQTDVELYFKGNLANDSIEDSLFLTSAGVEHLKGRLGVPDVAEATGGDISYVGDKTTIDGDFQITTASILSGGNFMTAAIQGSASFIRVVTVNPGVVSPSDMSVQFYSRTSSNGTSWSSWAAQGSLVNLASTVSVQLISDDSGGFPVANWRITETISIDESQNIPTVAGTYYQTRCVINQLTGDTGLTNTANSSLSSFTTSEAISGSGTNASTLGNKALSSSGDYGDTVAHMDSAGVMEVGRYIDMHYSTTSTDNYDWRMQLTAASNGHLNFMNDGGSAEFQFQNNGDFHANGQGFFRSTAISSDPRLKKNAKLIDNPLARLRKIEGVTFDWKDTSLPDAGVMSPGVRLALPCAVTRYTGMYDNAGKGYDKVNYNAIIGLLVESIKALEKQVKDLQNASTN